MQPAASMWRLGTALRRPLWLALALALGGCAPTYVFEPAVRGNALVAGLPAARYAIPPAAPQGDVRVASFGTTKVHLPEGPEIPVLQVRLVVANNGNVPWTLDTREQYGAIPGEGTSRAVFVGADRDGAPIITIQPGGQRTVDLYFPLPEGMSGAGHIPHFDVIWRVDAGGVAVAERTPFERFELVQPGPSPYYNAYAAGYGPYFWYDPLWPSYTFAHPVIIYPPRPYPYAYRHGYRVYRPYRVH
jgi:hypothetical protein